MLEVKTKTGRDRACYYRTMMNFILCFICYYTFCSSYTPAIFHTATRYCTSKLKCTKYRTHFIRNKSSLCKSYYTFCSIGILLQQESGKNKPFFFCATIMEYSLCQALTFISAVHDCINHKQWVINLYRLYIKVKHKIQLSSYKKHK